MYTGFLVVSNITTLVLPPDVAVAVVGGKELKSPDSGAILRLAMFDTCDLVVSVRRFLHQQIVTLCVVLTVMWRVFNI